MTGTIKTLSIAAALTLGIAASARADLIATMDGNDCSGVFGQSFEDCSVEGSPVIIKFDFGDEGGIENTEINSLFPTIDGSEFSFEFGPDGSGSGTWTYTPGTGDPAITFFVAKGGPMFNLFSTGGLSDEWFTPTNPANDKLFGLSHLTFYDHGGEDGGGGEDGSTEVPEPSSLALFGTALALAGAGLRRRQK